MTSIEYITLFVSIFFIIFYNIWRRNKDVLVPNWPIIGMLPSLWHNQSNIHDFITLVLKQHSGTFHFKGPLFTNIANFIITSDPMNVHHITNKNFNNYGKGSDFSDIFDVVPVGMLVMESGTNEWKQARKLFHSLLKGSKSFEIFLQQNIKKKIENCLLPYLDHHVSKSVQVMDLQDIFERNTFDIVCTFLFGFDPNFLPYKYDVFPDSTYVKAISVLEDMLLLRHCTPKCIWKLQKWLQIGQEKKGKEAQENIHQFLSKCISYYKDNKEKIILRNSCLVKEILKEGLRNEEMKENEKYVRDVAISLLIAGNGTISSALSWFFWLLSTHPIVEAKIIREMKDNCLKQGDNLFSNLNVEELDKLVYLHGAICETLRLYSPIAFEHICAIKSDILPSGDYVRPNTKIIYSLYAMGRMEQIWGEDCLEFKPERWISNKSEIINVPSYKFIAFNTGVRSCLGKDISFVQMKMVAVAILWNFCIKVVEGHSIVPRASIVLRMEHGLKVNISKRSILRKD